VIIQSVDQLDYQPLLNFINPLSESAAPPQKEESNNVKEETENAPSATSTTAPVETTTRNETTISDPSGDNPPMDVPEEPAVDTTISL